MKVYKVEFEVDDFSSLLAKDEKIHEKRLFALNGISKKEHWPSILMTVIDNENAPVPEIYCCEAAAMVLYDKSLELLEKVLPQNIEYLPVKLKSGIGYVINIIGFDDCFDDIKSEWLTDDETDEKLFVDKFSFLEDKVPDNTIFKIYEDRFEIFCSEGDSVRNSFKYIVEKNELSGISFELVWDSSLR